MSSLEALGFFVPAASGARGAAAVATAAGVFDLDPVPEKWSTAAVASEMVYRYKKAVVGIFR